MNKLTIMFPGFKTKAFTMSFDDGHDSDIPLAKLMLKYDLKGSFNLCAGELYPDGAEVPVSPHGHRPMTEKEALEILNDPHFEIVSHGYLHEAVGHVPTSDALYDMIMDRRRLEELFDCFVKGHVYPYGSYNKGAIECAKLCGFKFARTAKRDTSFLLPESDQWLEWHPTAHFLEDDFDELLDRFITLNNSYYHGKIFYAWAHSFEFINRWDFVEEKFKKIAGREDTWYATNGELYDYVEAYRSLEYTAATTKVYNPTNIDVCVRYDGGAVCVHGGETVEFCKNN